MERSKPPKKFPASYSYSWERRTMNEQKNGCVGRCVIDVVSYQSECVEKNLMGQWQKPAAPTQWMWFSSPTTQTWTEDLRRSFRPLMPATVSDSLPAANILPEPGLWNPVIHSLSRQVPVQKSALYQTWPKMRWLERLRRHERWSQLQWVMFTPTADF